MLGGKGYGNQAVHPLNCSIASLVNPLGEPSQSAKEMIYIQYPSGSVGIIQVDKILARLALQ